MLKRTCIVKRALCSGVRMKLSRFQSRSVHIERFIELSSIDSCDTIETFRVSFPRTKAFENDYLNVFSLTEVCQL